jgi:hypothetical protein
MTTHLGAMLSLSLFSCSLWVHAEPVTYFYSDLPPYEFTNTEGVAAGIGIDKVREALQAAGFEPEFKFYSVSRGVNALHSSIDFTAVVSPSELQKQQFRISQHPLYYVGVGVVRLSSTASLQNLRQLNDLPYLTLSETKFAYLEQRPEMSQFKKSRYEVETQQDALRLILNGKYPYFLSYAMSETELTGSFLVFDVLEQHPVHLVLSKQHPNAERLIQRVNAALTAQPKSL